MVFAIVTDPQSSIPIEVHYEIKIKKYSIDFFDRIYINSLQQQTHARRLAARSRHQVLAVRRHAHRGILLEAPQSKYTTSEHKLSPVPGTQKYCYSCKS